MVYGTDFQAAAVANRNKEQKKELQEFYGRPDQRRQAFEEGYGRGREIFYDDPDMIALRRVREDLAKGYDGSELGAIRATARGEIAGQRATDARRLSSNLARGGVGGARAAAIRSTADQKYGETVAEAERKIALDSASMKRQGADSLQDFMFRQKYGAAGMGVGNAQLDSADYAAEQARKANSGGGGGVCFITTAACDYFGLADDCDELQTLRAFRDNVMLKNDSWKEDVKAYYDLSKELAPKLAKVNDTQFWADVFSSVKEAVGYVKAGKNQEAYDTYKLLVEFVKGAF